MKIITVSPFWEVKIEFKLKTKKEMNFEDVIIKEMKKEITVKPQRRNGN